LCAPFSIAYINPTSTIDTHRKEREKKREERREKVSKSIQKEQRRERRNTEITLRD
jgi:hypothetical protein